MALARREALLQYAGVFDVKAVCEDALLHFQLHPFLSSYMCVHALVDVSDVGCCAHHDKY